MSMTDPLADMLTRIRNGQHARLSSIEMPASNLIASVLEVLQREGYIRGYNKVSGKSNKSTIKVELKYLDGLPVIKEIKKVSKPGRRVYSGIGNLKRICNGLGISILSTSKGVLSDHEARQQNIGGEVLCYVF